MDIAPEKHERYAGHDYFDGIHTVARCESCEKMLAEIQAVPRIIEQDPEAKVSVKSPV